MLRFASLIILIILIVIIAALRNDPPNFKDPKDLHLTAEEVSDWDLDMAVSDDYLRSTFAYRYGNSFVYIPPADAGVPRDYIYKVYPLCCDKCREDARLLTRKQKELSEIRPALGIAKLISAFLAEEPPRDQAQAADGTQYVVHKVQSHVGLTKAKRDSIKFEDVKDLMITIHRCAEKLNWVIRDTSIANVCVTEANRLVLQHIDYSEPIDLAQPCNLFYTRYSVLKHLPRSVFFSDSDYLQYIQVLNLIKDSKYHGRDYHKFFTRGERVKAQVEKLLDQTKLVNPINLPKPPSLPRPKS